MSGYRMTELKDRPGLFEVEKLRRDRILSRWETLAAAATEAEGRAIIKQNATKSAPPKVIEFDSNGFEKGECGW